MRNGFLWSLTCVLAGAQLASAQQESSPTPTALLASASLGAPEVSKENTAPAAVTSCWTSCCDKSTPHIWVSTDYLLWWVRGGPVNSPLVTTGSPADPVPGALGQPNTQVLFGDRPMGYGALSGVRLGAGIDFGGNVGIEGNYFLLGRGVDSFAASSNGTGNPLIARPFFNNQFQQEDSLLTSTPDPKVGPFAGTTTVVSYTQLQGWELNFSSRLDLGSGWKLTALGGFRSLNLNEDLVIQDSLTPLAAASLTFLGQFVNPPNMLSDLDRFHTSNTFYGGQIGGRLEWQSDRLTVGLLAKLALGVNQQIAVIDGSTTATVPGVGSVTAPGGVLALPTNIGRYYRSAFSVVPEGGLNLGWDITPRWKATLGYTFLFWSQVARPGEQIDRNLNPALQPSNQNFGNGLGAAQPTFSFHDSGFWAQGFNVGLEFKF
jgi:hypothetical protein